jgi:hypothetical protein
MEKTFDFDEKPLSLEEIEEIRHHANNLLGKQKKRAVIATICFIASCSAVVPFLAGNPLHRYWETVGKYILLLSMGLLIPFGICVGWAWSAWVYVRDVRKIEQALMVRVAVGSPPTRK